MRELSGEVRWGGEVRRRCEEAKQVEWSGVLVLGERNTHAIPPALRIICASPSWRPSCCGGLRRGEKSVTHPKIKRQLSVLDTRIHASHCTQQRQSERLALFTQPKAKTRTNDKFPLRRNRQVSLIPKCLPVLLVPSRKLFVHGHRFGLWLRRGGGGGRASSEDVAVWGYSGKLKCG